MNKEDLRKIVDSYLIDDGLDRDIVLLANQMGIEVAYSYSDEDFVAFTYIDVDRKIIYLNKNSVLNIDNINCGDWFRFILAYQLAEYVSTEKITFVSVYKINRMEMKNYMLAQKIVDRSYKYKKEKSKSRKLSFFRIN